MVGVFKVTAYRTVLKVQGTELCMDHGCVYILHFCFLVKLSFSPGGPPPGFGAHSYATTTAEQQSSAWLEMCGEVGVERRSSTESGTYATRAITARGAAVSRRGRRAPVRCFEQLMSGAPHLFYEPNPHACCQWANYNYSAWSYYPYSHSHSTGKNAMSIEACATACVATEGCTGIEVKTTFELGSAHVSDYCGFWYDNACSKDSDPGWRSACCSAWRR